MGHGRRDGQRENQTTEGCREVTEEGEEGKGAQGQTDGEVDKGRERQ